MASTSGQDNPQPLSQEEMAAKQEESLKLKMDQFLPRFAAKFKEDAQGIRNLKQPPCVKLVSKEGKKFWVPRRIILTRCPGLKLILEEKREDCCGPVELTKLGSKTVEVLIQYLEDGTLHPEWRSLELIPELCEVANDYELSLLFQFLEESLVNLCDSGRTAFTLIDVARRLGMAEARLQIINWMKSRVVCLEAERTAAQRSLEVAQRRHRRLQRRLETLEATLQPLRQRRMETED